jgi:hypothetical protein
LKNGEARKWAKRKLKKKQQAVELPEKFEKAQQQVGAAKKTREGRLTSFFPRASSSRPI